MNENREVWLVFQYEDGKIINAHINAFLDEEKAKQEAAWQNKNELSECKWDCEVFNLRM